MISKTPEDDLFAQLVQGVTPLKIDPKVTLTKGNNSTINLAMRRRAATEELAQDKNFLSGEYVEPVDALATLEFRRPGLQDGAYKNLRMGKYQIDARLDLHNMTVEQARGAVFQFLHDCMSHDIRCALLTHGKSEGRAQPAQLKSCIAHWLPQFDAVLAFHSAQKRHGASGATYVLLKKSEKKKQENRELYNRL